jgi:hypothetical protein
MLYPPKNTALWTWQVRLLTEWDDVRTIGLVVDMWERDSGRRTTHDTSLRLDALLIRLLRRLEPKDYYLLNDRQRRYLYEELKGYTVPLVTAILQAVKQVGDSKAIRYVEPLAQGRGVAAKNGQIQAAAQECLPVLRARAELEQWLVACTHRKSA